MTTTEVYNIIKEAIENKKSMLIKYGKHERKMSPHVLGFRKGVKQALFYQISGGSRSGLKNDNRNWRCMKLGAIKKAEIIEDEFVTGDVLTDRPSTCVDRKLPGYCEVKLNKI